MASYTDNLQMAQAIDTLQAAHTAGHFEYPPALACIGTARDYLQRAEWMEQAYELGRTAAQNSATWVLDGNSPAGLADEWLARIAEGEDVSDVVGRDRPTLSGEWAGDPTPYSLACDIAGQATSEEQDELAEAWEAGVGEAWEVAVCAELRKWSVN